MTGIVDERWFHDVISRRDRHLLAALARVGLSIMTPFYHTVMTTRNWLYDKEFLETHTVDVPVVSVGNITTGGTGKTPMVAWLVNWFQSRGKTPAIISRGYRSDSEGANDELRVLEQLCPNTLHVQNADRAAAARETIRRMSPDVLILDDGFQHRRLARNVDLVLIDAVVPWGYGRLLPRGLLREPESSLRRATTVILTRADQLDAEERESLRRQIARYTAAPIVEIGFRPQHLLSIDGETAPFTTLEGKRLFGFCGIGNPESFRLTLADLGCPQVMIEAFRDHHHYTADDLQRLKEQAAREEAEILVTTQKDLVKLTPEWIGDLSVWAVVIGAEVMTGGEEFEQVIGNLCGDADIESTSPS